jgi:hypothetical protein
MRSSHARLKCKFYFVPVSKFWLEPLRLKSDGGFSPAELRRIKDIIMVNSSLLMKEWHEYFRN